MTEVLKPNRKEITNCITMSVIAYFVKKRCSVFKELGLKEWGLRRADVLSFSLKKKTITIIEVKSGHADYKADKKFEEYLPYCNTMYIAIPKDSTWIDQYRSRLKELGIGIMELNTYGEIRVIQNAKRRTMKKRTKYDMLARLVWRCGTYSLKTHRRKYAATSINGIRYCEIKA